MDRNSIIGLSLIGLIIIAYSIYTQPSKEELQVMQHRRDSLEKIEKEALHNSLQNAAPLIYDSASTANISDSAKMELEKQKLGDFAQNAEGIEQILTLENKDLKVLISS
jgi:YidC/Oxa1 family membrane protein insertase